MAIGTFAELQTAAANWPVRSDTTYTNRVTEFITLAESRINRDLGTIRMAWTDVTLTGSTSSRTITLPTGFVEAGSMFLTTYSVQTRLTPYVTGSRALRTQNGIPTEWAVNGANVEFDCPCDQAHTFLFRYRARWQLVAVTATTNWLLTNHPDVYLAATLVEGYKFMRSNEEAVSWEVRYKAAVDEVNENEARSVAVATLAVDPALIQRQVGTFNYTIGE